MLQCEFCGKKCKSNNSLAQHRIRCSLNPDEKVQQRLKKIKAVLQKNVDDGITSNQYIKAKRLGLDKPKLSNKTIKIKSELGKKQNEGFWTEERRNHHSECMKKVVENNPESYTKNNVCGRVRNIEYNGVTLKGSWELKTAQWLDSQSIKWENEPEGFPYDWNGREHKYFPDFYLSDQDVYVEVKGYKTERDNAKWSQFPNKLIIIDKHHINKLNDLLIDHFL